MLIYILVCVIRLGSIVYQDGFTVDDINSLEGIAPRDILSLHIMHYKKSRKM